MGCMPGKNVIAAGHPVTVQAGQEMLWLGGNAFDAAVAAVFASIVAEPTLTSAGGGGYLMAAPRGKDPVLFDFFVDMPSGKPDPDTDFAPVEVDFGTARQEFHAGMGAVAVPGNIAGLLTVHEVLGSLDLKEVLAPAARAARDGVRLNRQQAYLIRILSPILARTPAGQGIFLDREKGGIPVEEGFVLTFPEFADFLETLSREGQDLFYRGEVADRLDEMSLSLGGLIRKSDLEAYRVKAAIPIECEFAGYRVLLNPPPAQSGRLIRITLRILDRARCQENLPITVRDLVLAFDLTCRIRNGSTVARGDRAAPETELSLDEFASVRFPGASSSRSSSRGSTTHVSVLDAEGNAAAVTTSNGEGSGCLIPGTGIMLNNMLGEEDINPGGFHRHPAGRRLPSMMSPTIVLENQKPVLVTGTSGSNRIRSALTQILIHSLYEKMDILRATEQPRLHLEGSLIEAEPGIEEKELAELAEFYEIQRWSEKNLFFGGVNSATPAKGAADSRRGGASVEFAPRR